MAEKKDRPIELLIATHSLASLAGALLHPLDLCRGFKRVGHDASDFTLHKGTVSANTRSPGDRHRRREVAKKEAGAKDQEISQLERRLRRQRERNSNLEAQLEARQDPPA